MQEVTKLSDKEKDYIFVTLDALIRDFKNKHAYASWKKQKTAPPP